MRTGKILKSSAVLFGMIIAISLFFGLTTNSRATPLYYNISLVGDFGTLSGVTGSGSFSIDSTSYAGAGAEFFGPGSGLLSFGGSFNGHTFSIANDLHYPSFPSVSFFDGVINGLSYQDHLLVMFNDLSPGFRFSYDNTIGGDLSGGTVAVTEVSTVPLPATLPLFLSGLTGLGLVNRRRKNKLAT